MTTPDQFHEHDLATGVWIAYHCDWSGFRVFPTEIEALRYAVGNFMSVGFLHYCEDHLTVTRPGREAPT